METLLKKREILRDENGMFAQHGEGIKKRQYTKKKSSSVVTSTGPGTIKGRGPGRPKGSQNKVTLALKEMVLKALDELGGVSYLVTLGTENSSAFASILGKVLPTTLQASESDRGNGVIRFERVIVLPDGTKHVEGKTPKQLPPPEKHETSEHLKPSASYPHAPQALPAPRMLPEQEAEMDRINEIKDLD